MYIIKVQNQDYSKEYFCKNDNLIETQMKEMREGKRTYYEFELADDSAEITVIINPAYWGSVLLHKL